jgi:hypothetical protein
MTIQIPFMYVLVENSKLARRASMFHLITESDIALLRCLMTLMLLPANTRNLEKNQPFFVAAIERLQNLPQVRKAENEVDPPSQLWCDLLRTPLPVVMVDEPVPEWLLRLAALRDVGVLSPSMKVVERLKSVGGIHSGLLKGNDDLREAYRVYRELLAIAAANSMFSDDVHSACAALAGTDLFAERPRLSFIPPFPLPQPEEGRPAAYLLNRLSNNVNEPGISPRRDKRGVTFLPHLFEGVSTHALPWQF